MNRKEQTTSQFIPLSRMLVHKLKDKGSLDANTALSVEDALEELILSDPQIRGKIEKLTRNIGRTHANTEKLAIPVWRAMVRPLVTMFLTLFFIVFLIIWLFASILFTQPDLVVDNLKELFPVFLGIYGSVIGFWFGEHTAERAQEKQAQLDLARAGKGTLPI